MAKLAKWNNSLQKKYGQDSAYFMALLSLENGNHRQAEHLLKQAEKNIANQKKNDLAQLKENTIVKEKEIKRRILSSTENAMTEINQSVARSSVELAKKAILQHIEKADKSALIDNAIASLDKFIK